jgi:hypothetical protein
MYFESALAPEKTLISSSIDALQPHSDSVPGPGGQAIHRRLNTENPANVGSA